MIFVVSPCPIKRFLYANHSLTADTLYHRNDTQLWLISFALACVVCLLSFLLFGWLTMIKPAIDKNELLQQLRNAKPVEVVMLTPKVMQNMTSTVNVTSAAKKSATIPPAAEATPTRPKFARTSTEQKTTTPQNANLIGEHDTIATSDTTPILGAPNLPNQKGRNLYDPYEIETTETKAQNQATSQNTVTPQGIASPKKSYKPEDTPAAAQAKETPPANPAPTPSNNSENRQKTLLQGDITRQGVSAQDVIATPLGKYHAQVSRAVEKEFHTQCQKYKNYTAAGTIRIRIIIDEQKGLQSVNTIEMIDAGEVQKGFTIQAIRTALIPPLPKEVKKELKGEPLELIYNFYF